MNVETPVAAQYHPLLLVPQAQHYDWGKCGSDSLVARFLPSISEDVRYAELWIGAHPSRPSLVAETGGEGGRGLAQGFAGQEAVGQGFIGQGLDRVLDSLGPEFLGKAPDGRPLSTLPFLLKVLSIEHPLSIQVHPDRAQARVLHMRDPQHYPDENHKPEIAIALSDDFRLLCGFRPAAELRDLLRSSFPESRELLGGPLWERLLGVNGDDAVLRREVFSRFLNATSHDIGRAAAAVRQRLLQQANCCSEELLFLALAEQFGGEDQGLFVSLTLGLHSLARGQGIFVGPGVPHAYLGGDAVECMASSDNVVRGGLTSKFVDRVSLVEVLNFNACAVQLVTPEQPVTQEMSTSLPGAVQYSSPANDFRLERIPDGTDPFTLPESEAASLLFCFSGHAEIEHGDQGLTVRSGQAVLFPAASATIGGIRVARRDGEFYRVTCCGK